MCSSFEAGLRGYVFGRGDVGRSKEEVVGGEGRREEER